jgi:hypothetical protein
MDPHDPAQAQQIVVDYARLLERDLDEHRHPAAVDSLPYAKKTIKTAICTSVLALQASGQLTDELRQYFETAYTCLAEYVDDELVDLMTQYRDAADRLTAGSQAPAEKTRSAAWQTVSASGALAGELARTTTLEVEALRSEFRRLTSRR